MSEDEHNAESAPEAVAADTRTETQADVTAQSDTPGSHAMRRARAELAGRHADRRVGAFARRRARRRDRLHAALAARLGRPHQLQRRRTDRNRSSMRGCLTRRRWRPCCLRSIASSAPSPRYPTHYEATPGSMASRWWNINCRRDAGRNSGISRLPARAGAAVRPTASPGDRRGRVRSASRRADRGGDPAWLRG